MVVKNVEDSRVQQETLRIVLSLSKRPITITVRPASLRLIHVSWEGEGEEGKNLNRLEN